MIVDFSIEDNVNRSVFIGHRLMPAGDVNDRKTTMPETDVAIDIGARIVWTAMRDDITHSRQRDSVNGTIQSFWDCDATNSTHRSLSSTVQVSSIPFSDVVDNNIAAFPGRKASWPLISNSLSFHRSACRAGRRHDGAESSYPHRPGNGAAGCLVCGRALPRSSIPRRDEGAIPPHMFTTLAFVPRNRRRRDLVFPTRLQPQPFDLGFTHGNKSGLLRRS